MGKVKRSRIQLPPKEYKALCERVMERDQWKCRVCKRRQNLVCHHIVYRSHGGDDIEFNLITLCGNCHDGIHTVVASSGAHLVLLPEGESKEIDANEAVKFLFVNGWKPRGIK